MQLDTPPIRSPSESPHDRVVANDPAWRVVQRTHDRPRHVIRDVELRAEARNFAATDEAAVDSQHLVHLGALGHRDHRPVGMRECEVPLLREEEVEVGVGTETLVELEAATVEPRALGRSVVGADDGRVSAGGPGADVALLEDGDVRDAVVFREVVRGCEAVRPAADDHDVVPPLQLSARTPHPLDPEEVFHRIPSSVSRTTSPT